MTPRFFDLRSGRVAKRPKIRTVGGGPFVRLPQAIDTVVLHQTAVQFGVSKPQLKAAAGDRELALARRGLNVACHVIAFEHSYAAVAPLLWSANHANFYNARSLGLEVDGLYEGVHGDRTTLWRRDREPTGLTPWRVLTAREALRWLVEEARREGIELTRIVAHRQSSKTRRSDPGEALWKAVALWAEAELGLQTVPAEVVGDGRPIPVAWQVEGVGVY